MVNGYFIAALVGLLVVEAIEWTARLLNLRALRPDLPPEFAGGVRSRRLSTLAGIHPGQHSFPFRGERIRPRGAPRVLVRRRFRMARHGGQGLGARCRVDGAALPGVPGSRPRSAGTALQHLGGLRHRGALRFQPYISADLHPRPAQGSGGGSGHRDPPRHRLSCPLRIRRPVRMDLRVGGVRRLLGGDADPGAGSHHAALQQVHPPSRRGAQRRDRGLRAQGGVPARGSVLDRRLSPVHQGQRLLHRVWEEKKDRALRYADRAAQHRGTRHRAGP